MEERGDQIKPALHPAGERFHQRPASILELGGRKSLIERGLQVQTAQALEFAENTEVFFGGEAGEQGDGLGNQAEIPANHAGAARHRLSIERDGPGFRRAEARDK